MSGKKCAVDCRKAKERYRRALEAENANVSAATSISDATDYQSLPGKSSTPSQESGHHRRFVETQTRLLTPEKRQKNDTGCDQPRRRSSRSPGSTRGRSSLAEAPELRSKSARTEHYTSERPVGKILVSAPARHRVNYEDSSRQQSPPRPRRQCPNTECGPKPAVSFRFKKDRRAGSVSSYRSSKSSSESSDSSRSLSCPELCEQDPVRLPLPKSRCQASCPKQARLDKQRERHQAVADKYILNSGLRYFDDLCHCSLKCLMTQICMDPFVKKTVASAAFFILGMKVCFELDSWFIPF